VFCYLTLFFCGSCQNEAESRLWELVRSLITIVDSQLLVHGNAGVQINAIKCLQVLILLLSKSSQVSLKGTVLTQLKKKKKLNFFYYMYRRIYH
jgi:symplekin